jgi:hypothetical protein
MAPKKSPGNRGARSKMRQSGDEEMGSIARPRSLSKACSDDAAGDWERRRRYMLFMIDTYFSEHDHLFFGSKIFILGRSI